MSLKKDVIRTKKRSRYHLGRIIGIHTLEKSEGPVDLNQLDMETGKEKVELVIFECSH